MIVTTNDRKVARTSLVPFGDIVEDLSRNYGLSNVLRDSKTRGLTPLTAPKLLDLRLDCPDTKDRLWSNWYSTASGVYVVGDKVYAVHGLKHPLTDYQRVRTAIDEGLVNHGAKLNDDEVQAFRNRTIEGLRDYETFLRETQTDDLADEQFGVVADASLFSDLPNYYMELSKWVKDPRAIMLVGGKRKAEAYAEGLSQNKVEKPWLSLDVEQGKADRGRLVFVDGGNYGYGLNGNDLDNDGRLVGVAPGAQVVAHKNGAPQLPLESRVELSQEGRVLVHEGRTYLLAPEGLQLR